MTPMRPASLSHLRAVLPLGYSLQFDHLTRVIGRHLPFILPNTTVNYLAWLFPPDEILPNPDLSTRRSPITIVREVIKGLLAAPVAHYYGLLEIARVYHDLARSPLTSPSSGLQTPPLSRSTHILCSGHRSATKFRRSGRTKSGAGLPHLATGATSSTHTGGRLAFGSTRSPRSPSGSKLTCGSN